MIEGFWSTLTAAHPTLNLTHPDHNLREAAKKVIFFQWPGHYEGEGGGL